MLHRPLGANQAQWGLVQTVLGMSRTSKPDFNVMVGVAPLHAPLRLTDLCFVTPTDLAVGVRVGLSLPLSSFSCNPPFPLTSTHREWQRSGNGHSPLCSIACSSLLYRLSSVPLRDLEWFLVVSIPPWLAVYVLQSQAH